MGNITQDNVVEFRSVYERWGLYGWVHARTYSLKEIMWNRPRAYRCNNNGSCGYFVAGLLRLQQIYQGLYPGNESFQVSTVRRIGNVSEALHFLRSLEDQSRWTHKYVVLDCSADMAKEIVVSHVRDISLGKRTYHYLLSGLVRIYFILMLLPWPPPSSLPV